MRQYLLILDGINTLSSLDLILSINDIDASIVLPELETKFDIYPPRDITSSIADTLSPTNESPLTVVSTPLLLIFDNIMLEKDMLKNQSKQSKHTHSFILQIGIIFFHISLYFSFRCRSV